jgi:hypothetical protein
MRHATVSPFTTPTGRQAWQINRQKDATAYATSAFTSRPGTAAQGWGVAPRHEMHHNENHPRPTRPSAYPTRRGGKEKEWCGQEVAKNGTEGGAVQHSSGGA